MKTYRMKINGEKYKAKVLSYKPDRAVVNVNGIDYVIEMEKEKTDKQESYKESPKSFTNPDVIPVSQKRSGSGEIVAPIPGVILAIHKKVNDRIEAGDPVFTLEAMKMESELVSPVSGVIKSINISKGDTVVEGDLLAVIEEK